ncbi:MAG: hypothetical protein K1W18_06955 [Oscillospiraceae bacterium]
MAELIDKQSLTGRLVALFRTAEMFNNFNVNADLVLKSVENEPCVSADGSQAEARWNRKDDSTVCCSACGVQRNISTQKGWNFCPFCGAKITGGDKV